MKKVIFVCLLSLSVCLSAPNQTQVAAPGPISPPAAPIAAGTGTETKAAKPEHPAEARANITTPNEAATVPAQNSTSTNSTSTNSTQPAPTSNETSSQANKTQESKKTNTTDSTNTTVTPSATVEPAKNNTKAPVVPSTDGKKNDTTTTSKADNISPTTVAPTVQTKTRAFDGPSFIGGIILTLGLLAIGFMGFKYYKNQTERNYHTL